MGRRRGLTPVHWMLIVAAVLAVGVGGVAAYVVTRPAVTVTAVIEGPVVEAFYATGTLQPVREYPVRATAAGILAKPPGTQPYRRKGGRGPPRPAAGRRRRRPVAGGVRQGQGGVGREAKAG